MRIFISIMFLTIILMGCNVSDESLTELSDEFIEEDNRWFVEKYVNEKNSHSNRTAKLEVVDSAEGHYYPTNVISEQKIHSSIIIKNTGHVPVYLYDIEQEFISIDAGKYELNNLSLDMNGQIPKGYIYPGDEIYFTGDAFLDNSLDLSHEGLDDFAEVATYISKNELAIEKTSYTFKYGAQISDLKKHKKGEDIIKRKSLEDVFNVSNVEEGSNDNNYEINGTIESNIPNDEIDEVIEDLGDEQINIHAALSDKEGELLGVMKADSIYINEIDSKDGFDFVIEEPRINPDLINDIEEIDVKLTLDAH